MKKLFGIICAAALSICMVGCDTSEEDMIAYSKQGGQLVGMFFNTLSTKMSAKDRNTVIDVMNTVSAVLPTDATFEETWMPQAKTLIAKYVEEGKLSADLVPMITTGCELVCRGIDFVFVKHPDWKTDSNKVNKIVKAFIEGFTFIVKPVNSLSATATVDTNRKVLVDPLEMYIYLSK